MLLLSFVGSCFLHDIMIFVCTRSKCLCVLGAGLIDAFVSALNQLVRDTTKIFVSVNACMREFER